MHSNKGLQSMKFKKYLVVLHLELYSPRPVASSSSHGVVNSVGHNEFHIISQLFYAYGWSSIVMEERME